MTDSTPEDWDLWCDRSTFEKCVQDSKFAYIVALSRAANALRFVHAAMRHAGPGDAPEAQRARMNSYLFASALLNEALNLVQMMNQSFKDDIIFQTGLRLFMKNKDVRSLKELQLNEVRNNAVFHFLPERFAEVLGTSGTDGCIFMIGRGIPTGDIHYFLGDIVSSEILVGCGAETGEFNARLASAMTETKALLVEFLEKAKALIQHHLGFWGFQKRVKTRTDAG